ncbi:hypothetical protein AA12717_1301 [Gluconacetobacter sacchari DSM 12717]|uniref:Phosphoribosylanthranilate isomerase n=1 Tax=Gluconacetobacter sacchari DSM 12717 TaxID=1307940 RepID=A0ABQ0P5N4_9PROT|nr:hypothetical protein AA12717_1301 [Gluconacetobacter sacchari DSM 12717]
MLYAVSGVLSERPRRHAIEAGVTLDGVVVGPQSVDDRPSVGKVAEQVTRLRQSQSGGPSFGSNPTWV